MALIADVSAKLLEPIETFMTQGVTSVAGVVSAPLKTGVTLYIVIFGLMIVLGYVRTPISDYIVNVFKICIIIMLVTNVDIYNQWVTKIFFTDLPDGIGNALTSIGSGNSSPTELASGSPFDNIISTGLTLGQETWANASWDDFALGLVIVFFMGLCVIACALMFLIVLYAKISLALIIVLGPLFIALALFKQTASFTQSFVGALANFAILQILIYALLSMLVSFVDTYLAGMSSDSGEAMVSFVQGIGLFIIAGYAAVQMPGVASALSGAGFQIGGQMVGALMAAAGRAAATGARAPTRVVGNAARKALGAQRAGYRNNTGGGSVGSRSTGGSILPGGGGSIRRG